MNSIQNPIIGPDHMSSAASALMHTTAYSKLPLEESLWIQLFCQMLKTMVLLKWTDISDAWVAFSSLIMMVNMRKILSSLGLGLGPGPDQVLVKELFQDFWLNYNPNAPTHHCTLETKANITWIFSSAFRQNSRVHLVSHMVWPLLNQI